jgi:hypothetical protein
LALFVVKRIYYFTPPSGSKDVGGAMTMTKIITKGSNKQQCNECAILQFNNGSACMSLSHYADIIRSKIEQREHAVKVEVTESIRENKNDLKKLCLSVGSNHK